MAGIIWLAETAEAITRCFPVLHELRPQFADAAALVAQVQRQKTQGYRLAALEDAGEIRAAAGFRFGEYLAWGRILYVDDLVTRAADRSRGYGAALLDWLATEARRAGCAELHLDSGVQRHGAHRFYLGHRLDITSHHFARRL